MKGERRKTRKRIYEKNEKLNSNQTNLRLICQSILFLVCCFCGSTKNDKKNTKKNLSYSE